MKQIALYLITILAFGLSGCDHPTPKPNGYFRIDTPKTNAKLFSHKSIPYTFVVPENCSVRFDSTARNSKTLVISYPHYKAQILCTYQTIDKKSFRSVSEESRQFVYRHSVKAASINEKLFQNPEQKVYGIFYYLKGNVATPCQFSLTDSAHHYFRGALYFDCAPKADSLAPVVKYIEANVLDLMQTFQWK
ncbi:MAG: gliding motility protein GldD [Bacteroidales bacterium]|nr:gliding motility protein GldD [Bacteroidales bacterium]